MHPSFALWMWSMTMIRIMQNPFGEIGRTGLSETPNAFSFARRELQSPGTSRLETIGIRAERFLRSDVIERPLPDTILDRLADLHWMERDPTLAI